MTPEQKKLTVEQIRRLLQSPHDGGVAIAFDLVEENSWDLELARALGLTDRMIGLFQSVPAEGSRDGERLTALLNFSNLARTDYPAAVQAMLALRVSDPPRYEVLDAINSARYAARYVRSDDPATWQEAIEHEQMVEVTMEGGGDGPWEGITEVDGEAMDPPTRRPFSIDHAPEHLQRELDREYPNSQFMTVWYDSGGNFDDSLRDAEGLWRQVRTEGAGREAECPWRNIDADPTVGLESTYYGEGPGQECALCAAALGEEHGVIYLGELGAAVFRLDVMADVTSIEVVQVEGRRGSEAYWEIRPFVDGNDESVEPPELEGGRRNEFKTREEALDFAREITRGERAAAAGNNENVRFRVIPLPPEED